jgi:eukaryotic-like serine/threonine-protein kinase
MLPYPVVDRSKKTPPGTPALRPEHPQSGQSPGQRPDARPEHAPHQLDAGASTAPEPARAMGKAHRAQLAANTPAAGMPNYVPPPDPHVGTTIAERYRVERKLGEGGMGGVYLATHVSLEKQVALKILHSGYVGKPDIVKRFLQEARAASRIRHENVIDITDFGATPEGVVFFAMEILDGQDLHDVITRAKLQGQCLSWERSKGIFLQICAALSAAHASGVIHRDLKPENIYLVTWLGQDDFVKLLDFGIAKLTEIGDGERKLTRTGMLFGTPEYMSPEQARGDTIDHRADIYALGCILHQLITGRVPFESDNFMSILSQHLAEEPAPIPAADLQAVGAPLGINAVMLKALAKAPGDRHFSADEMAAAILALDGEGEGQASAARASRRLTFSGPPAMVPVADAAAGSAHRARAAEAAAATRPAKRSRVGWIAAVMLVIGLAAGGGALWYENRNASAQAGSAAGAEQVVPAQVVVRLDSTPPHAAVYDESGALLGRTPLAYAMVGAPGVRRFRFALDGHQDKVLEVIASADSTQSVRLEAYQPVATQTADVPDDSGDVTAAIADQSEDQAEPDQGAPGKRQDRRRRDRPAPSTGPGADPGSKSSSADTPVPEPTITPKPGPNPDPTGDPVIKNPFAR